MRVLIVVDDYLRRDVIGGGDIIAQSLRRGLESCGHVVGVACHWGNEYDCRPQPGVFRVFAPKRVWKEAPMVKLAWLFVRDRVCLKTSVARFKPDVLYCLHQSGLALPTVAYVNALCLPKVYRMGDEWLRLYYYGGKYPWTHPFQEGHFLSLKTVAWCFKGKTRRLASTPTIQRFQASSLVFNSIGLKKRVLPQVAGWTDVVVVPNGVDSRLFAPIDRVLRTPPHLLYVGRMVPHKGVHNLILALQHLRSQPRFSETTLTLVGLSSNHDYLARIRLLISEHRLGCAVTLAGAVPHVELHRYFSSHDIFVFPSTLRSRTNTVEGCPATLLEALASGIPVVARIADGTDEIVSDGKNCVGVYTDDPVDLARAIHRVASDGPLYHYLCSAGPVTVREHYSFESMISTTENILKRAVDDFVVHYGRQSSDTGRCT